MSQAPLCPIKVPDFEEVPDLPSGWKRKCVLRRNGQSAGKFDVYYYSPCGKKIRSRPELERHFAGSFDLNNFDFRQGRFVIKAVVKTDKKADKKGKKRPRVEHTTCAQEVAVKCVPFVRQTLNPAVSKTIIREPSKAASSSQPLLQSSWLKRLCSTMHSTEGQGLVRTGTFEQQLKYERVQNKHRKSKKSSLDSYPGSAGG